MESLPTLPEWVSLEHQVAQILTNQELHGWTFSADAAWEFASTLREELRTLEATLRRKHSYVAGAEFTPKRNNARKDMSGCILYSTKRTQLYFTRSHRMDINNILWLDAEAGDSYWEACRRRSYSDRDWVGNFYDVCEMFDGNENAWDVIERRERLAEACYE